MTIVEVSPELYYVLFWCVTLHNCGASSRIRINEDPVSNRFLGQENVCCDTCQQLLGSKLVSTTARLPGIQKRNAVTGKRVLCKVASYQFPQYQNIWPITAVSILWTLDAVVGGHVPIF